MITTGTIALILRALGTAVQMPGIFGNSVARFAPILHTLASFAELPEKTRVHQEALLELVRTWVRENRPPSDAELAELQATVATLDEELRTLRAKLAEGAKDPGEHL